jgi:hypothetical protein
VAGGVQSSNAPASMRASGNFIRSRSAINGSGSMQVSGAPIRASTAVPLPVPAPISTIDAGTDP